MKSYLYEYITEAASKPKIDSIDNIIETFRTRNNYSHNHNFQRVLNVLYNLPTLKDYINSLTNENSFNNSFDTILSDDKGLQDMINHIKSEDSKIWSLIQNKDTMKGLLKKCYLFIWQNRNRYDEMKEHFRSWVDKNNKSRIDKNKIVTTNREIEVIENNINIGLNRQDEIIAEIARVRLEIEQLKTKIPDSTNDITISDGLTRQLKELTDLLEKIKKEKSDLDDEIPELQNELEKLKKQLEERTSTFLKKEVNRYWWGLILLFIYAFGKKRPVNYEGKDKQEMFEELDNIFTREYKERYKESIIKHLRTCNEKFYEEAYSGDLGVRLNILGNYKLPDKPKDFFIQLSALWNLIDDSDIIYPISKFLNLKEHYKYYLENDNTIVPTSETPSTITAKTLDKEIEFATKLNQKYNTDITGFAIKRIVNVVKFMNNILSPENQIGMFHDVSEDGSHFKYIYNTRINPSSIPIITGSFSSSLYKPTKKSFLDKINYFFKPKKEDDAIKSEITEEIAKEIFAEFNLLDKPENTIKESIGNISIGLKATDMKGLKPNLQLGKLLYNSDLYGDLKVDIPKKLNDLVKNNPVYEKYAKIASYFLKHIEPTKDDYSNFVDFLKDLAQGKDSYYVNNEFINKEILPKYKGKFSEFLTKIDESDLKRRMSLIVSSILTQQNSDKIIYDISKELGITGILLKRMFYNYMSENPVPEQFVKSKPKTSNTSFSLELTDFKYGGRYNNRLIIPTIIGGDDGYHKIVIAFDKKNVPSSKIYENRKDFTFIYVGEPSDFTSGRDILNEYLPQTKNIIMVFYISESGTDNYFANFLPYKQSNHVITLNTENDNSIYIGQNYLQNNSYQPNINNYNSIHPLYRLENNDTFRVTDHKSRSRPAANNISYVISTKIENKPV
jgi:hypothetical protein